MVEIYSTALLDSITSFFIMTMSSTGVPYPFQLMNACKTKCQHHHVELDFHGSVHDIWQRFQLLLLHLAKLQNCQALRGLSLVDIDLCLGQTKEELQDVSLASIGIHSTITNCLHGSVDLSQRKLKTCQLEIDTAAVQHLRLALGGSCCQNCFGQFVVTLKEGKTRKHNNLMKNGHFFKKEQDAERECRQENKMLEEFTSPKCKEK